VKVVPILVAYHTVHWIRAAVESYLEHFPAERLLVVDNNPRRGQPGWQPDCERERHGLASHPQVDLIDGPAGPSGVYGNRTHGAGIDVAWDWCRRRGAEIMLHLEPDCLVSGTAWRDHLLEALAGGAWMAGSFRQSHGPIHPTPSAWRVAEVRASFRARQWRGDDQRHPRFRNLVDLDLLRSNYEPLGLWHLWRNYWDTGEKAWFAAAVQDRAALVQAPGFHHYWHGSGHRRLPESALLTTWPELRPYFEVGAQRLRAPVEDCPFRSDVRRRGVAEIASCGVLRTALAATGPEWSAVTRDVCEACRITFPPTPEAPNPAVAAQLYDRAERILSHGGVPGCPAARAEALRATAEANLDVEAAPPI
jgi:hypothetical protein